MKKSLVLMIILAALACAMFTACGSYGTTEGAEDFDITKAEDSPEWVGSLDQAKDDEQLFVVAAIGKTTAYVSMHQKDEDGNWKQIITTPGYIGKYGLGKTKEGDAMTPIGTFHFNAAFGIADDPGCAIEYQQVTEDDYWSGDQREGYHYNEMVSIADLPDLNTGDSEHIVDYTNEYQYCLNISYNAEGTPGLGSAIFLHCLGAVKPYTGGCVAIPKDKMVTVMQNVSEDCVVVIDSLRELSPATWNQMGLLPEAEE
jgi:L,D-peptidoglycan transpeptidase YkuD (ErfK/YbiS/YcfS/YnhG family)